MKISAFIIVLLFPISAIACWDAINENIRQTGKELITKTTTIVLAKAYKKETQGTIKELVIYHFKNIKTLKGNVEKNFNITLYETTEYTEHTSFNHHKDMMFWKTHMGRIGYANESCIRPIPKFIIGETYLLFNGSKDSKASELIEDIEKDKWYNFVVNYIRSN